MNLSRSVSSGAVDGQQRSPSAAPSELCRKRLKITGKKPPKKTTKQPQQQKERRVILRRKRRRQSIFDYLLGMTRWDTSASKLVFLIIIIERKSQKFPEMYLEAISHKIMIKSHVGEPLQNKATWINRSATNDDF